MTNQSTPIGADDLNAYIDGALTAGERRAVEAALAGDPALAEELRELRATASLLSQLPEYTPRRSFTLGAEHAKAAPVAAPEPEPGKIVRLLPIVRSLSVAAVLAFMVIAGAFFLDFNGDTVNNSQATFEQQNEIMANTGETDSHDGASQQAEDAAEGENGSSMTEVGEAASVGNEPMDDLTQLQDEGSNDEVAQSVEPGTGSSASTTSQGGDSTSWWWTSVIAGTLAVALVGLWFALAQVGRQPGAKRS